jgi:hypothetical protein
MKAHCDVELILHMYLTSAPHGGEWLPFLLQLLYPWHSLQVSATYFRYGGIEYNSSIPTGHHTQVIQHVDKSLYWLCYCSSNMFRQRYHFHTEGSYGYVIYQIILNFRIVSPSDSKTLVAGLHNINIFCTSFFMQVAKTDKCLVFIDIHVFCITIIRG